MRSILDIATHAGELILKYFEAGTDVTYKEDDSPLTQADRASHEFIVRALHEYTPDIPVLSEESHSLDSSERLTWPRFWLVDPLDGTKEFLKKTGEFTVNIALIDAGRPVEGVV